jgi:hypothetical protein
LGQQVHCAGKDEAVWINGVGIGVVGHVAQNVERCRNHFVAVTNRFQNRVLGEVALIALQAGEDFVYCSWLRKEEYHQPVGAQRSAQGIV